MLCFGLLGSAILLVLLAEVASAPQHSLWMLSESQKPLTARCWGPGMWPHPAHCRLFSVCYLDRHGSIVDHLFLCPLGSSYSSRTQQCIINKAVMPACATSLEDDFLLNSLSAEQLSSDINLQLRCGEARTPYCADNETLVICTSNKFLVGSVNCSAQQWAKNTQPLQCNKSRSSCVASSTWQLHPDSAVHTSTKNFPAALSDNPSSPRSAVLNSSLLLHVAPNHTDLNLHLHSNKTTITDMYLQMTPSDKSTEGNYNNDFYVGDEEYDVYDLDGSLPNYLNIKCTQKGLQCADNTTIIDCYENLNEPFFIMSCNSLLYSDDGENVVSYCDNDTSSCILTSKGMTVTLNIKTVNSKDLMICESYSGLRCINNEMLIACSGNASSTHYTVSCNGVATPETDSFLQGHCYENSCMFMTVHQTSIYDILANYTENYDTYHLVSTNTNNTKSESPYSNMTMSYHLLPPEINSSAGQHLYTNINENYHWQPAEANSVITESLQTNTSLSYYLLPPDNDSATNEPLNNNTRVTHYLMPPEADSTMNESLYRKTSSVTNTTDIREKPHIPVEQVDMFDLYDKYTAIKYNLSEAGEYFVDHNKTEIHITNSSSTGNSELITETAEKFLQTVQDDPSEINDLIANDETPAHISLTVPTTIMTTVSYAIPPETPSVSETLSTEIIMPVSKVIQTEAAVSAHETEPIETLTHISRFFHTENAFSDPDTTSPVSELIPTETVFPVPETVSTEITPLSKTIPTENAFSIPGTVSTEVNTPVSTLIDKKKVFLVPDTVHTEMTPVSRTTDTETVPTESVILVSNPIYKETASSVPTTDSTEVTTPVLKVILTGTASPLSKIIPTQVIIQSVSETTVSKLSAYESELKRTSIMPPTAEMNQSEHVVTASNPSVKKPLEVYHLQQENVCQKVGIQCIDSLTLGACLPDLTLSYTVSCKTLLPYVMSKHYVVYCNNKFDTCAVAPLL